MRGDSKVSFIVGKRGSGKTLLARELIKRQDCPRIVCYDSNGHDYSDGVVCNGIEQLKHYWRRVIDGPYRLIFRSESPRKDFETVCQLIMAAGNTVFVVDEVDMYFDDGQPSEAFGDVIRRGRHNDIELIGITQRPRQMGEIRSMANVLYIFETHEPSDLQYYKQSFSERLVERIRQLRQYEYVKAALPYDEDSLLICKEGDDKQSIKADGAAEIHQQPSPGGSMGLRQADGDSPGPDQSNPMA